MKKRLQANSARPPFLLRALRREPHLYSAICKARLIYSRRVVGAKMRELFRRHESLLKMDDFEQEQVRSLREDGYALIPEFFSLPLMDRIFRKADAMFHNLEIDARRAYSIQTGERSTLDGVCYEELAATEKTIALRDPLLRIPETLDVAFHESILKIAANFLGYVPPLYRATIVRDFPHDRPLHSSNFHKDNDESDSLQIFIYLVDIDDTRGPLVYVPGSNHYDVRSCRPRLSRDLGLAANDGRLSDEEVERIYPRREWARITDWARQRSVDSWQRDSQRAGVAGAGRAKKSAAHSHQTGFARVQGGSFARHEGEPDPQMRFRADERITAAFRARDAGGGKHTGAGADGLAGNWK